MQIKFGNTLMDQFLHHNIKSSNPLIHYINFITQDEKWSEFLNTLKY